ncbi:ABC transporter substrate-binding protein [Cohnella hashimotonis]|uniref:Sugar ABC transporter substrate-binding protein n=1 Tax=Cohnella hashimotonis TaxID=2826895 RepID=A0ABT6TT44_9BACL|nr:sugar ABC transporter substrate-binding protein [Cohnella hashimotonis]
MKRRFNVVSLLLLAILVLLSACSSSKNEEASSGPSGSNQPGSSSAEASQKPAKQVTLKLGLPGSYDVTSKEIVDGFIQTHPNIKVEIQEAPWGDFTSKISTQIAGNTAPDIWLQENAAILGYGKRGVAEDLSQYIERDLNAGDYIDALFAAKTPEGQVWGVPHGINPIALAYNEDVFKQAGVALPTDDWTYQDLIDNAKQLTVKDQRYGFVGSSSITTGWFPWIKQAGGSALDESLTKANFDDSATINGLSQLIAGIQDGYFTDADFVKANGGEMDTFATGKAALMFFQYSQQVAMSDKFPNANWNVVKIPKSVDGKRYVPMVTNSWLIYSKASQDAKDAAWEFLKYYLSEASQAIVAKSGSTLPVRKTALDLLQDVKTKPLNKAAFTDGIAEGGVTLDENASWSEWRLKVQQVVNEMVAGNVKVEEGAKQIQTEVQKVLDDNA